MQINKVDPEKMNLLQEMQQKAEMERILACNEQTEKFGLALSVEDAKMLAVSRTETLKEERRVEFGEGILKKIIITFCDSQYINCDNYAETLVRLQSVFYLYKNEVEDELTDDELLNFMKEQFDGVCYGSVEYLEETCLERFAAAIRAGYEGHRESGGYGEYSRFSEETHWDQSLYLAALEDLF